MKAPVKKSDHSVRLFCFSPPVMIATMFIEVALAIYVIVRYHMNQALRLIVLALGALGLFQLSEYFVCGGLGADASAWSRMGFVAITALPPLGLHLLYVLSGKQSRKLVGVAYASMAAFMGYFLASSTAFVGHECTGNYVIFQIGSNPALIYGAYYYGWLLAALIIGYRWLVKNNPDKKVKQQITGLMAGYLVFLIPTGIANSVRPETRAGIPSIMCGFAVLFALILALYIAPRVGTVREKFPLSFLTK
jgi:hypothetical protein